MSLKHRLSTGPALVAPGVYDPLTALLVEQAGFEAAFLSGASIAYTQLGRPDIGLLGLEQVADVTARIRDRVGLKLIVDADTGFGNALNVQRTVRVLERAGANAIQLEDQTSPKRCGHLLGKTVEPAEVMVGKIKAAVDARLSSETLIVARTDAIAVEGFEAALARAELYREAGADVLFVEAPQSEAQMRQVAVQFSKRIPLLANMVEGGSTPIRTAEDLTALGFALVITPGALVRALVPHLEALLATLKATGSTAAFAGPMTDLRGVNARIGLDDIVRQGQRFSPTLEAAQ
uniref:isocitrate lyase/PEP mutase family protein n=1 Tax=uncultured Caulobacter sp. TaxID=158749 RepID=UPI0025D9B5CE|nr:isocitrate lyase/PEP mutase family protein [uncultured Caulobacter sp.]